MSITRSLSALVRGFSGFGLTAKRVAPSGGCETESLGLTLADRVEIGDGARPESRNRTLEPLRVVQDDSGRGSAQVSQLGRQGTGLVEAANGVLFQEWPEPPEECATRPSEREKILSDPELSKAFQRVSSFGNEPILDSLMESGRLTSLDSSGRTLLENLDCLAQMEFDEEHSARLPKSLVMKVLLQQLDQPARISQNRIGTCTVTTTEHLLAKTQPSEYARVISGLLGKDGVRLQAGAKMVRPQGVLVNDGTGRTAVSRVFQASMMRFAKGGGYGNLKDMQQGLNRVRWAEVTREVLGKEIGFTYVKGLNGVHGAQRESLERSFERALQRQQFVQVDLKWAPKGDRDAYHALSISRMDKTHVYFQNPHGLLTESNTDPQRGLLRETTNNEGEIKVTKDEFFSRLASSMVELWDYDPSVKGGVDDLVPPFSHG